MHLKMASFMFLYAFYHNKKIAGKNTNLIMLILSLKSLHRFPITPELLPAISMTSFQDTWPFRLWFPALFPLVPQGDGPSFPPPTGPLYRLFLWLKNLLFHPLHLTSNLP